MRFHARTLFVLLVVGVLSSCAAPSDSAAPNSEHGAREAAIRAALARNDHVTQINMQRLPLEVALQFLAHHLDVPMAIQWDELEARGIHGDEVTTTLNLFDASYGEALRAALWLLRPARGEVGCEVTYGGLIIGGISEEPPAETDAQKAADARIVVLLAEPLDLPASAAAEPAEDQFYALSFAKKISLIVDWDELARAGIRRDRPVAIPLETQTAGDYLKALMAALAPRGDVACDIHDGMIRVSTPARLGLATSAVPPGR